MKVSIATGAFLAQTTLCGAFMQAREAKVTAAAVLDRRTQMDECSDGKSSCGDGNGCCPLGSKCTSSKGMGMCADACYSATHFCDFGHDVKLCCQPDASCDYSQSLCTQHKTEQGSVWTSPPTTAQGTTDSPLPRAPVFSSTSGEGDSSALSKTETDSIASGEETQSTQSSDEASSSSAADKTTTNGGAAATKSPKNSGSGIVASLSAGVLVVVFGIMVAL